MTQSGRTDRSPGEGKDPAPVTGARTGIAAYLALGHERFERERGRAERVFDRYRDRPLVDLGLRWYERDREAVGTVIGSAIAFRLFLFFVPMLLFVVGLLGFFGDIITPDVVDETRITGSLAEQIDSALDQAESTRWLATLTGLVGMASTGRTLSRALAQASCLAWRMPLRAKASLRMIGGVIGLVVGLGLTAATSNRLNDQLGIGFAGLSFVAIAAAYVGVWFLISWLLPRPMSDPGVLLPGAFLVGCTIAGLQAVSQLYLPSRFTRASELYGAIGVAVVTLGWFFIMGRVIVASMSLDAVVYERFGSVSGLFWSVPGLRALPRRWPAIATAFSLDPHLGPALLDGVQCAPMDTDTHVEVTREIAASPEAIWAALTDITRMGEWSPECHTCTWVGDATEAAVGARFQGQNRNGDKDWTTEVEITELEAAHRFVFEGVVGDYHFSRWGYVIEPTDSGSSVTEFWDELRAPEIIPMTTEISGVADRPTHNRAGMETTLERLAAAVE